MSDQILEYSEHGISLDNLETLILAFKKGAENENAIILMPGNSGLEVIEFNANAIKLFLKFNTERALRPTASAFGTEAQNHNLLMTKGIPSTINEAPVVVVFGNDAPSVSGIQHLSLKNFEIKPLFTEKTGREKRRERRLTERRKK